MLLKCSHCDNGLLLPMLDITAHYYKEVSLYIHDHPYTVCTHCNLRTYESLENTIMYAEEAYDEFGATSFDFMPEYEVVAYIVEPNLPVNKKSALYVGTVLALTGGIWLFNKYKGRK
ncbi:hypothetical protein [Cytobacillus oceanisediminis]|uniref:hypothetical protein n=1 Tax=Cytobacillus oceanisediminis TaxID=665099 RepID=UPI001FB29079|nr:hypothetical protein [Cytobacillus oceanisediminis]UOE58178.1 hypothetical protein IRB79_27110 [Cytobacillus oceanisediminis]